MEFHPVEDLQARVTDRGLVVTLGDQLFVTGRADLRASSAAALNELIDFLDAQPKLSVVVEGHTDSLGAPDFSLRLSQRRADAVVSYLVARQVPASRLRAVGQGDSCPVASNQSAAGREYNRRVEVIIKRPTAVPP